MVEFRDQTDGEDSSSSSDDLSSTTSDSSSSSDESEGKKVETGAAAGSDNISQSPGQPESAENTPAEIIEEFNIVGPRSPEETEEEADTPPRGQGRNVNLVTSTSGLEQVEDNIELDYDIDIAQELSTADLNPSEPVPASVADGKGNREGDESKKPVKSSPSKKNQPKKVKNDEDSDEEGELTDSDSDGELTATDEEEVAKAEVEDGEIQDGRSFNTRTQLCRFFARGLCTWGFTCRFLHPGINDKGNYHMIERPGMSLPPGTYKPPEEEKEEKKEGEEEPEEAAEEPEEPPKPETPWERGLRQAKEALKRASRKKEMELDIEDKKMHMTLDEVKNKESNAGGDPYYDNLQYDELDPIQAMAFEEHHRDDNWEKAGFEESFEVEWTQANYELPHLQPPPEREWRDDRMRGPDPRRGYDRGGRQRYRSPVRNSQRDYRDRRPQERRSLQRHALGSDGWVDPWQRVKPGERRRNRRRSSSGSSSFSSLSGSSRHSSASSFSSRSRSRTRTPTPLRNIQKPKSNANQSNAPKSDDRRGNDQSGASQPPRPQRKGPEWPTGPTNVDRPDAMQRDKMAIGPKESVGASGARLSRKDQPSGGRKEKSKFKRRGSSVSSSSSSSSDSSSSRSRSSSSDSSDSSSSDSSSSSSSDSSASDSDDLYAGMSKPHKEKRQKKPMQMKKPKERERRLPPSKPAAIIRKQQVEEKVRETMTSTSKAGIKLTLVNKAKVPSKKRVLDSPPPEPMPPSKKATLPMPEAVERPKPLVPKAPVLAPNTSKAAPAKPTAAVKPSRPSKTSAPAKVAAAVAAKKSQPNRRDELLKQLKAVEEAIAKKRSKT